MDCVGSFCFLVNDQSLLPEKLFINATGEAKDKRLGSHWKPIRGQNRGRVTNVRAALCLLRTIQCTMELPLVTGTPLASLTWINTEAGQSPLEDTRDPGPGQ